MNPSFPVDDLLPELVSALSATGRAVVQAPPGSGKTTRIPPALRDAFAAAGEIVVLEPRRIAARAAAGYVARQGGGRLGDDVGYQVRFERVGGPKTRLWFVTEGMLTRRLAHDPFLENIAVLVLDEFHERHIHADVALAVACELQRTVRPDLKLVVMSATIDAEPIAAHLGGCPILTAEGRRYPVDVHYLTPAAHEPLPGRVVAALDLALRSRPGDILVFLPGIGEIRRVGDAVAPLARTHDCELLFLHGNLSLDEQQRVLCPSSHRRIILATNVAETALTIDGVTTVIDSGLARVSRYDPKHGINSLELTAISRASADQRTGRAGRTAPGTCFRLWSSAEQLGRLEREVPEIARLDLAELVLQLRSWGLCDPAGMAWLDAPSAAALRRAESLLAELGATDSPGGSLTDVGECMLRVAATPRLARMLVAAERLGQAAAGCLAAALASERDIRSARRGITVDPRGMVRRHATFPSEVRAYGGSDLVERAELFVTAQRARFERAACDKLGLDRRTLVAVDRARENFARGLRQRGGVEAIDLDADVLRRSLLAGFPDRVVRRREVGSARGLMVGGMGVVLDADSAAAGAELYVALELDRGDRKQFAEARVRLASAIEASWLAEVFPGNLHEDTKLEFDPARRRVIARTVVRYLDLPLSESIATEVDARSAGPVLAAAALAAIDEAVELGVAERGFLARVGFMHAWLPEAGAGDPDELLATVIGRLCAQRRSFAELRRVALLAELQRALPYEPAAILARDVPEAYELPSGRRALVRYEGKRPPVVAARVQELFGLTTTPRLARGRAPLVFEILAPNMRPVQITEDLASFWRNGYPEVRKQLRGRYPKHEWPENPFAATPTSRPKRRSSN